MERQNEIIQFIAEEYTAHHFIEPNNRHEAIKTYFEEAINTYQPEVIVKAGIGNPELNMELINCCDSYVVIVDPNIDVLQRFKNDYLNSELLDRVKLINGNFVDFPVDYYAAALLMSFDYLNLLDSAKVIDEFRRALEFEAILLLGMVVLHEDDMDGLYDEYNRKLFPLHTDYYMESEIKTVLDLNEFEFIKAEKTSFESNLQKKYNAISNHYSINKQELDAFISDNHEVFQQCYGIDKNREVDKIVEPYFIGTFMRKMPAPEDRYEK